MSDDSPRAGEPSTSSDSVLGRIVDWYHVPVLAAVLAFMLWVRTLSWEAFIRGGEVLFSGNDPWYHFRQISYVVNHWPSVMPFDPWSYFPYGTSQGQFGTLFDQLIATAALVVGAGNPSHHTVAMVTLFAPPVLGALVALPTYAIGKRVSGRLGGLVAAVVLALIPGTFLTRSLVGAADHNIAEPLFQSVAVLAMLVAIGVAESDLPVWEQVADRDWAGLRAPLGWSLLAGVTAALYMWVWPPGLMLVGIFGVFFVLKLSADYLRGTSPDHVGFVAAVSMGTTGLLMLLPMSTLSFTPTKFSLLQPLFAFGVAVGAASMAWLAREWDGRDVERSLYPVLVGGIVVVGVVVVWLALPDLFSLIQRNVLRFVGFGTGARTRTIGEAQPWLARNSLFGATLDQYRLAFYAAVAGAVVMAYRLLSTDEAGGERQLLLVWFLFMLAAAFTQVRFNYYLAVPVAILTGYLAARVFDWVDVRDLGTPSDVSGYQVIVVLLVVLVVFAPFFVTVNLGSSGSGSSPAYETGANFGPGGLLGWDGTLQWMNENTPAEGNWNGSGNQGQLDYYGTYRQQSDFDYPAGSYGVLSWWDYGHWITTRAQRVPNANPFQQGTETAANFLLAPTETDASNVLGRVDENDAKTRYVMVDYQMILPGSKFAAPTQFYTLDDVRSDQFRQLYFERSNNGYQFTRWIKYQRYYESMMVRLYRYHGSAVQPQPVGVDWSRQQYYPAVGENITLGPADGPAVRRFDNMSAAREWVSEDPSGTRQLGGVGSAPTEYIPALRHYRLVKASSQPMSLRQAAQEGLLGQTPSFVKTFERVPGATVQGTAPANTTVTASVNMSVPSLGTTFVYQQRAQTGDDGSFTMVLPYSTTGYDQWDPEQGHTNVSVRAVSGYVFQARDDRGIPAVGTANVTEGQVIGQNSTPVTVDVEPLIQNPNGNGSNNSTSDSSGGTGTGSGGDSGNATQTGNASADVAAPTRRAA